MLFGFSPILLVKPLKFHNGTGGKTGGCMFISLMGQHIPLGSVAVYKFYLWLGKPWNGQPVPTVGKIFGTAVVLSDRPEGMNN